jgi:hypothetical protein
LSTKQQSLQNKFVFFTISRPGAGLFSLSGVCVSLDVHRRFKEKKQSLTNSALAF